MLNTGWSTTSRITSRLRLGRLVGDEHENGNAQLQCNALTRMVAGYEDVKRDAIHKRSTRVFHELRRHALESER